MNEFLVFLIPIIRNLALAIITLVVGLFVINRITDLLKRKINKVHLDDTLKPFIISSSNTALKVLLAISVIKILGVDTTSFVAVIGAAGLAVGLAFQGTLSNFAGGVLLLTLRPFKVGDYIEASSYSGTVEEIQVLYTQLKTPDNKVVVIPNGTLSNASIVNYSVKDTRRVDFKFGTGYECNTEHVKKVLNDVALSHEKVLKDPEPFIRMYEHGDNALVFAVRLWVDKADYWPVYFDIIENVKQKFDEENISIPYPQMDIHLDQG